MAARAIATRTMGTVVMAVMEGTAAAMDTARTADMVDMADTTVPHSIAGTPVSVSADTMVAMDIPTTIITMGTGGNMRFR